MELAELVAPSAVLPLQQVVAIQIAALLTVEIQRTSRPIP